MDNDAFGLRLSDFAALGRFAPAGLAATTAALERVRRSYDQHRVPIAGAAVHMGGDEEVTVLAVGNNGRIPPPPGECAPPDPECRGYPTDHGETATIRQIEDVHAVDWSNVVFTTSLNPCIMCNRTLTYLWTLGLNKIVVADVSTYGGTASMLAKLEGMTLVELNVPVDADWMKTFARTYPWDWNADIGMIPPADLGLVSRLPEDPALQRGLLERVRAAGSSEGPHAAGVVTPDGKLAAAAVDQRSVHGDNPTWSGPMIAMGEAGSSVNLHECALVFCAPADVACVGVAGFGYSSLGACELFAPGVLLVDAPLEDDLRDALEKAHVTVVQVVAA